VEGSPEDVLEMVTLEDHIVEVVVQDVLDPVCVYTLIRVEMKTNTKTVAFRMFQKVQTTLIPQAQFFYFYRGEGVIAGRGSPDFF
jgi:hypothetical protein